MTGTIEQIGNDIEQIKAMGTDHIIFGHLFSSIDRDMKKMIEVTNLLDLLNENILECYLD